MFQNCKAVRHCVKHYLECWKSDKGVRRWQKHELECSEIVTHVRHFQAKRYLECFRNYTNIHRQKPPMRWIWTALGIAFLLGSHVHVGNPAPEQHGVMILSDSYQQRKWAEKQQLIGEVHEYPESWHEIKNGPTLPLSTLVRRWKLSTRRSSALFSGWQRPLFPRMRRRVMT